MSKFIKFYVRCAPGHTEVSFHEIQNLLQTLKGSAAAKVERERSMTSNNSTSIKNGLFVTTTEFRHGLEIAMRTLTIQDIEYIVLEANCKAKRDIKRRMRTISFPEFILPNSITIKDFNNSFAVHSRANKSIVNSSRFLKEEFTASLVESGVLKDSSTSTDLSLLINSQPLLNTCRLSLIENTLTVSVSLAGEMELYKRSYKNLGGTATAPLPEHHASACIQWMLRTIHRNILCSRLPMSSSGSVDYGIGKIIVPFAGTGTLGFESLLVLLGSSTGPGLFSARQFSFDSFPIAATKDGGELTYSQTIREQMRAEVASKLLFSEGGCGATSGEEEGAWSSFMPRLLRHSKVLFSDINQEALSGCKDNITSFIESSGNTFPESIFLEPKLIDFLKHDVGSILQHDAAGGEDMSRPDIASAAAHRDSRNTTFVLLNPPFGLRLAKQSSTAGMYARIAAQLIAMRDLLAAQRSPQQEQQEQEQEQQEQGGVSAPCLAGLCLCADEKTWSTLVTALGAANFGCETTHFSLGGNDMRVVCFWDSCCAATQPSTD